MSRTLVKDFFLEMSKGNIPNHSGVIVRGHNPSQSSASGFVDISEFGDLTYLAAAEIMNIVSTSTDDDGDPAGIGALTLKIDGVDDTYASITENVTLNGTTNVLTSNSYLRVNSMTILTAGSSGWNVGNITATGVSASTIQDEMDATESLSQSSHYTVPLATTGYLMKAEFNAAKISGASPEIEFKAYVKLFGGAWLQLFDKRMDTAVTDEIDVVPSFPAQITAKADIRFRSDTDSNSTEVRTRAYIILVSD